MLTDLRRKLTLYNIDILNREYISGWCFHRVIKSRPVTIDFRVDDELIGQTTSNLYRQDLSSHDLHPNGQCGFEYIFPKPLNPSLGKLLSLHVNGSGAAFASFPLDQILQVFKPEHAPLFFMHIPKTAGTSFNNYILQYFGHGRGFTHIQNTPLKQQQTQASSAHFMSGHITLEHIPPIYQHRPDVDYHTMVRDPIKQFHSHLGWVKGIALNPNSDFFKSHDHTVQQMGRGLFQMDLSRVDNLANLADNLDGFQIDFFDNIQVRYFLDYRPDRVTQQDCDTAIKNIGQFKTIGLTERFDHYTREFCHYYQIEHRPITSVHNPAKVTPLFDISDSQIRDVIDPLVGYDLQLYQAIDRYKRSGE